jgi:hypothetical protein
MFFVREDLFSDSADLQARLVCVPCIEKHAPELLALQRLAFAAEMLSRTNHIQDLEALILRAREYYESTPAAMHEAEAYKQRCAEREEETSAWEAFCEAQENGGLIDVPRKTNRKRLEKI